MIDELKELLPDDIGVVEYRSLAQAVEKALDEDKANEGMDPPSDETLSMWFNALSLKDRINVLAVGFVSEFYFRVPKTVFKQQEK